MIRHKREIDKYKRLLAAVFAVFKYDQEDYKQERDEHYRVKYCHYFLFKYLDLESAGCGITHHIISSVF